MKRYLLSRQLLRDRADLLARDGGVVNQNFVGGVERVVAQGVRCLIVGTDMGRMPPEIARLVSRGSSRLLMGSSPRLKDGMVLRVQTQGTGTVTRYIVRTPQGVPSEHRVDYQLASLETDVVGELA